MAIPTTIEEEYARGEGAAASARVVVAEQLGASIRESRRTGSMDLVARRVRALAEASRSGDQQTTRGAAMELAEAAALMAVSLDLHQVSGDVYGTRVTRNGTAKGV